jgi:hypothetical protein
MQLRVGCDSVAVTVTGLKSATVYGVQVVDMATGKVLKVLPTKSTITASGSVDLRGVEMADAIVWDKSGTTKTMAVKETAATNCAAASLAMTGPRSGLGPVGVVLIIAGALLLIATRRRVTAAASR